MRGVAVALLAAILLAGCSDDAGTPAPGGPTNVGSQSATSSQAPPPPGINLANSTPTASLTNCNRHAVLMQANAQAMAEEVPEEYGLSGPAVVSVILLLLDCEDYIIGNISVAGPTRLAFAYTLVSTNHTGQESTAYFLESFASSPQAVAHLQSLGLPSELANMAIDIPLDGMGSFSIQAASATYTGTQSTPLDERGSIPDQSFLFYNVVNDVETQVVHRLIFELSSQTVGAMLVEAEGGLLGRVLLSPNTVAAIDRSVVDATFGAR